MKNPITNAICCDIILPVTDYRKAIELLKQTLNKPQWLRHCFIIVFGDISEEDEKAFKDWYYDSRVELVLPEVIITKVKAPLNKDIAALYSHGIMAGDNPFIYFQSQKDSLPLNIDRAINYLYKHEDISMCIGRCEIYSENKTLIEEFPNLSINGQYIYDCEEACKLFPSYSHPLSAVIRKNVFNKIPFWDQEKNFDNFGFYSFMLKCLYSKEIKIKYIPVTIKLATRRQETAVVIGPKTRQSLVHDIKLWLSDFPDDVYKEFQMEILSLLEDGSITTFKEIDARVEEYMDRVRKD